ncbi:VOC family protein [Chitinophaga sp. HK235]|uniref:VOC family protein n=1 Tax=Chitinophaga sp. HK235 TaxID=2952571 RepID=UPI001BA963B9|nr:VOC family protein [Chitinophaga sp. HK235]
MAALNPYLNFDGNCEEAFNFYKSVFGGDFTNLTRFSDVPKEYQASPSDGQLVMHVSLPISNGSVLMGSDRPPYMGAVTKGDSCYLSITTTSEEETQKLFNGLSAGGKVLMPLDKTFWGAYFGMFSDKYGVLWMVNYDYNQPG